jgi:hypothetical protein
MSPPRFWTVAGGSVLLLCVACSSLGSFAPASLLAGAEDAEQGGRAPPWLRWNPGTGGGDGADSADSDGDGIADQLEEEWARSYFPFYSPAWHDRCPVHGVLYRVSPHPTARGKLMILYDVLYQSDCGARGHLGDSEVFSVLADPSVPAPRGILAVRTIAHQGTLCETVMTCGSLPGCRKCSVATRRGLPYPVVYASANKHGLYLSREVCQFSFICDYGGCSQRREAHEPPMTNAGEQGKPMVTDLTVGGFVRPEYGWTAPALMNFNPWSAAKFAGAGNLAKDLVDRLYVIDPAGCDG